MYKRQPLITVISLPLTCLTVGLFQLVVNSFMLELASWLSVNLLGSGISLSLIHISRAETLAIGVHEAREIHRTADEVHVVEAMTRGRCV